MECFSHREMVSLVLILRGYSLALCLFRLSVPTGSGVANEYGAGMIAPLDLLKS